MALPPGFDMDDLPGFSDLPPSNKPTADQYQYQQQQQQQHNQQPSEGGPFMGGGAPLPRFGGGAPPGAAAPPPMNNNGDPRHFHQGPSSFVPPPPAPMAQHHHHHQYQPRGPAPFGGAPGGGFPQPPHHHQHHHHHGYRPHHHHHHHHHHHMPHAFVHHHHTPNAFAHPHHMLAMMTPHHHHQSIMAALAISQQVSGGGSEPQPRRNPENGPRPGGDRPGGDNHNNRGPRNPTCADDMRETHSNTVFLGRLDEEQDVKFLMPIFEQFGPVVKIDMLHVKRYAFVHYRTTEEAVNAVDHLLKSKELGQVRIAFGKHVDYDEQARNRELGRVRNHQGGGGGDDNPLNAEANADNNNNNNNVASGNSYAERQARQQRQQEGEPSHVIYVGSLPASVSDPDLVRVFDRFGGYRAVTRNYQKEVAFVHFDSIQQAEEALSHLRGNPVIEGHKVKLAFGRPREMAVPAHGPQRRGRSPPHAVAAGGGGMVDGGAGGAPTAAGASGAGGALMLLPTESTSSADAAAAASKASAKRPAYYTRNRGDALLTIEQKTKGLSAVSYFYCGIAPPHLPIGKCTTLIAIVDGVETSAGADIRHPLIAELEDAAQAKALPHALAIITKRLAAYYGNDNDKRLHVYYLVAAALFKLDAVAALSSLSFKQDSTHMGGSSEEPVISNAVLENLAWLAAIVAPQQDAKAIQNMRSIAETMTQTLKKEGVHDELAFELLSAVLASNRVASDVSNLLKRLKQG